MPELLALIAAAFLGALTRSAVELFATVPVEVRRHDRQVAERDRGLEEWIVVRHRQLQQRWNEIAQQAVAKGVERGGAPTQGRKTVSVMALYEWRDERREADDFVLRVEVEEGWPHALYRGLARRPFPSLDTPACAARLIDYWEEGTERNALLWSLDDILRELPEAPRTGRHSERSPGAGNAAL